MAPGVEFHGRLPFQTSVARRNPIPTAADGPKCGMARVIGAERRPRVPRPQPQGTVGGQQVVIQVAKSEAMMHAELVELVLYLVFGLPFGVAARWIGRLRAGAARPDSGRPDGRTRTFNYRSAVESRLPVDKPNDELGRLATVFNETLMRLENAFTQMQRFTGDVSHELRTPLTALRTVGEVASGRAASPVPTGTIIEACSRMRTGYRR